MYSWHLKKQGCEDCRQNQVKSMSSTMWRGRLQKKEAERCEQRFSAWLGSWQCLSTFLCFSVLIFLWCLWIAFTIRKFLETFLCADSQSSHWDRFPTGSLIFWKLTRGQEGALELCAPGKTRPPPPRRPACSSSSDLLDSGLIAWSPLAAYGPLQDPQVVPHSKPSTCHWTQSLPILPSTCKTVSSEPGIQECPTEVLPPWNGWTNPRSPN